MVKMLTVTMGVLLSSIAFAQRGPQNGPQGDRQEQRLERLTEELSLTEEQTAQVGEIIERHTAAVREANAPERAKLDSLREDFQASLTDEQKAILQEERSNRSEEGHRGKRNQQRGESSGEGRELPSNLNLTEEQKLKWDALRNEQRANMHALRQQSAEQREAVDGEIREVLTEEQAEKWDELRSREQRHQRGGRR